MDLGRDDRIFRDLIGDVMLLPLPFLDRVVRFAGFLRQLEPDFTDLRAVFTVLNDKRRATIRRGNLNRIVGFLVHVRREDDVDAVVVLRVVDVLRQTSLRQQDHDIYTFTQDTFRFACHLLSGWRAQNAYVTRYFRPSLETVGRIRWIGIDMTGRPLNSIVVRRRDLTLAV